MNRNLDGIVKIQPMVICTSTTVPTYLTTVVSQNKAVDMRGFEECLIVAIAGAGVGTSTTSITFSAAIQTSNDNVAANFAAIFPDESTTAASLTGAVLTTESNMTVIGSLKVSVHKNFVRVVPVITGAASSFNGLTFICILSEPRKADVDGQVGQFRSANVRDGAIIP